MNSESLKLETIRRFSQMIEELTQENRELVEEISKLRDRAEELSKTNSCSGFKEE
jgi:FtsZ-binding cell division protein ZapB